MTENDTTVNDKIKWQKWQKMTENDTTENDNAAWNNLRSARIFLCSSQAMAVTRLLTWRQFTLATCIAQLYTCSGERLDLLTLYKWS